MYRNLKCEKIYLSWNSKNMAWTITLYHYEEITQKCILCTFDGDTFNLIHIFFRSKAHCLYETKLLAPILR